MLLIWSLSASIPGKAAPEWTADPLIDSLASSKTWKRLLHYQTNLIGQVKSDVEGGDFFFSPDGRTDPGKELLATLRAFVSGQPGALGKLKQAPQCAFPERYRFLKSSMKLTIEDLPCPLLDTYLARFHEPTSVTLVFSSAYPDSPASMFGHTFLRINAGDRFASELLDQGISYSASVAPDENPLTFYWLGITGGYPGAYSLVPYYVKVDEYTHSESRDLWEYTLSVTPAETLSLIRHLWELETNSESPYYFFDKNCAYQLLALLEVAKPDWDLVPAAPWVIPAETIKTVARIPGAIQEVKLRPSQRKKLLWRIAGLNEDQRKAFMALLEGKAQPQNLSDAAVLEALSIQLIYEKQKLEGHLSPEKSQLLRLTLARRSELPALATEAGQPKSQELGPEQGHDATRWSLSGGFTEVGKDHSVFQEIHWRSSYHDLLADDLGFLRFSAVEFPSLTLRYYGKSDGISARLTVDRLGLLNLYSISPWDTIERKTSWGLNLEYYSPKDFQCFECHAARLQVKVGEALSPWGQDSLVYFLGLLNFEAGSSFRNSFGGRLGPGLESATLWTALAHYKLKLGYTVISDLWQQERSPFFYQGEFAQSYTFVSQWELRAGIFMGRDWSEGKLTLSHYF